ncbi:MAG: hypothetical protein SW833_10520 [Cyanobacteriota bacterium]|nr:hypothetical protein [Cyanobacteriota bacterium]
MSLCSEMKSKASYRSSARSRAGENHPRDRADRLRERLYCLHAAQLTLAVNGVAGGCE